MTILETIIGAGLLGLLWKIQRELGAISSKLGFLRAEVDDHEARIRILEQ